MVNLDINISFSVVQWLAVVKGETKPFIQFERGYFQMKAESLHIMFMYII